MSDEIPSDRSATAERNFLPPWSWPVLVSTLAWGVIFLAIPPARQNFPLGDDWAFAHGAIWFAQGQGIHYSKWASMPQLGQWLWSWPFLKVITLPHVALRLSVLLLSWLGLAAFYDLLRQLKVSARAAAFAACVLALNPLYFLLQGTYMTDVPALSFALLALDSYQRAMAAKDRRWLLAATTLAVLAVITRQTMLAVPLAAGWQVLRSPELRRKPAWILSILAPVAICLYMSWWISQRADVAVMKPALDFDELMFRPFLALHWCGLVALPLCLLVSRRKDWRLFWVIFAAMMLAAGNIYLFAEDLPYGGLFPYSAGMATLEGTYSNFLLVGHRDILLTPLVRLAFSVLGCAGAAGILAACLKRPAREPFSNILVLFTMLQFCIILIQPAMFDRYLTVLFPGALFLVAAQCSAPGSRWLAGIAVAALSGLISVAVGHDWFSWNVARWDLGRQAIATKTMQPNDLEGGFEWDGWYACANPTNSLVIPNPSTMTGDGGSLTLPFSRFYFPQVTGRFALAFTAPTNSVVVATRPYSRWLPPAIKDFLLVQQR